MTNRTEFKALEIRRLKEGDYFRRKPEAQKEFIRNALRLSRLPTKLRNVRLSEQSGIDQIAGGCKSYGGTITIKPCGARAFLGGFLSQVFGHWDIQN